MPAYIEFSNPVSIKTVQTVQVPRFAMKSIFSDNSLVYYKKHSLSTSGAGTVRHSSLKGKRT